MRAVAEVESGRSRDGGASSWPWVVNISGKGYHFASRRDAVSALHQAFADGHKTVDVGCFQLNHRWHGHHFQSAELMLDPWANADYAARYLKTLHVEFGDWKAAAGAYHSRTPSLAEMYRNRIIRAHARLTAGVRTAKRSAQTARSNSFPLLVTGQRGGAASGSLVPMSVDGQRRPLF